MALRIKSSWHDDDADRSLDEIAGAAAFIAWRIAKEKAITLHGEDFIYESDEQRMAVIQEYLLFQLAVMDRIAVERLGMDDAQRKTFIIGTAKGMAGHVHDNAIDLFRPGDHVGPFIEKLNERGGEYAEFGFTDEGPTYPFYRHLGWLMQQIMGESQENRWVIDQVMDKDGPYVAREIEKAMLNLFE